MWRFQRCHGHIWRFLKTSENFRRHLESPKIAEAEHPWHFPFAVWRCITNCDLTPSAFYLKKEILSFRHSFHDHFLHRFEFTYFSIRVHEKLAHKREPVQDQSFQSAGVRLAPKAWEMANDGGVFYDNPKQWLQRRLLKFVTFVLFCSFHRKPLVLEHIVKHIRHLCQTQSRKWQEIMDCFLHLELMENIIDRIYFSHVEKNICKNYKM